ncbi:MarR family winged helix-turn-helix transcriptional regulator [Hydrogenophaga sp.]|uniref:MarR family winged helix-turn-helix transcriptional regulator n=1 Tax=Hydrogenophaga sp. TaxID=1904254 RepID=UPI0025BCD6EF|nr:MarR family winged helix-turn-helix transcriptional regulator [Hydrogenophaga sp.]
MTGQRDVAPAGNPKAELPRRETATCAAAEPRAESAGCGSQGGKRFIDDYLGYLLGQANHALFKDFEAAVRAAGLGSLEWRVLATLSGQAPMPVGQLAHEVLSQQPTVTKLVQRLAAQGWLGLRDDPTDQRRTLVQITPTGQRKIAPLIQKSREHEARVLVDLDEFEIRRLKHQLRQLTRFR